MLDVLYVPSNSERVGKKKLGFHAGSVVVGKAAAVHSRYVAGWPVVADHTSTIHG